MGKRHSKEVKQEALEYFRQGFGSHATNGLNAVIRKKRNWRCSVPSVKRPHLPANILSREFRSAQPGEKLVSDVTYLPTSDGGDATAKDNTVILDSATVTGMVYGGAIKQGSSSVEGVKGIGTNNTIKASGINKVKGIDGYENLELTVAATNDSAEEAVLSATDAVNLTGKNVKVNSNSVVEFSDGGQNLVIDAAKPVETTTTTNAKTLAESQLGTLAIVNQGAEFIAGAGMMAIGDAVKAGNAAFGAMSGGSSTYTTGSHIDVDSVTLMAGAATKINDHAFVAGFIEAGWGDSTSHVHGTKGDGDHEYYGVGLAAHYDFDNPFYLDGSLRLGRAKTEFNGRYDGDKADYDARMFYTSAHVGGGYVFKLTDAVNLDIYGRYVVTYLDSDDVKLHDAANSKLHIDSITTHALRGGMRFDAKINDNFNWYIGAAMEHVFNGDADTSVNGVSINAPTLRGNTGIGELGLKMKPSANSPWQFDIGAKGYVGKREGVSGNVTATYSF